MVRREKGNDGERDDGDIATVAACSGRTGVIDTATCAGPPSHDRSGSPFVDRQVLRSHPCRDQGPS